MSIKVELSLCTGMCLRGLPTSKSGRRVGRWLFISIPWDVHHSKWSSIADLKNTLVSLPSVGLEVLRYVRNTHRDLELSTAFLRTQLFTVHGHITSLASDGQKDTGHFWIMSPSIPLAPIWSNLFFDCHRNPNFFQKYSLVPKGTRSLDQFL